MSAPQMPRIRRLPLVAIAALTLGAAFLTGCASAVPIPTDAGTNISSDEFLAEHGLDGLDVRELVDLLDRTPLAERSEAFTSSITAEALILSDQHEHTFEIPMPDDLIYISVAPYATQTHECYNHSPTGCIGELQNAEITVSVTDSVTEDTIVDEALQTYDNGFAGLWLPRNLEGTLTIAHNGLIASEAISTAGPTAKTCITTMQLA